MDQRVTSNRNEDGSKESLHQIYERAGASARKPGGAVEDDSESDCVLLRQVDNSTSKGGAMKRRQIREGGGRRHNTPYNRWMMLLHCK